MRYRTFCERETSVIALGTMDFGGKIPQGMAFDFMDAYCETGGNFIDTARIYGDFASGVQGGSEKVIGRWMEQNKMRGKVVLSTKGGHPDPAKMHIGRLSREELLADIQRSLEALRCDCVDVYWLHRDDADRDVEDILNTLTELVERGMTRFVCVSNWTTQRIRSAMEVSAAQCLVRLHANQPQFSLARQVVVEDPTLCQMDAQMHALHEKSGLACVAFSAQAKGFLTKMDAQGEAALSDKARRRYLCAENMQVLRRAQQLSSETGHSVHSIALAYLTGQDYPVFPIAGVSKMAHVEAIRAAGDVVLTAQQRDWLRQL